MDAIPEWLQWLIALIGGGTGGGFSVHQWYKTKLTADQQEFNQTTEYQDILRKDIDKLRKRQGEYEVELAESRGKYYEMQDKYHQLKLNHEEVIRENRKLREEIQKLREEIKELRDKLDN